VAGFSGTMLATLPPFPPLMIGFFSAIAKMPIYLLAPAGSPCAAAGQFRSNALLLPA
jgi:hypothetical protein